MTTHIIHLADIHIRSGNKEQSRFDEYDSVFTNLIDNLKTLPSILQKTAIIIIAGDLFHHKLRIESAGLKLAINLLKNLGSLAPTYIIKGNHDYRQDYHGTTNEPDLIESLLTSQIPNVTYLNETGYYRFNNIGFGLVAIQDALWAGNTRGIAPELPPFPKPPLHQPKKSITNIALFHGPVSQCRLNSTTTLAGNDTYPLEWFPKEYDIIMLGDIHLQQIHNTTKTNKWTTKKQPWAYAGSLIQQDFGEPLFNHGYLLWDLKTKTVTPVHIKNPHGYITLKATSLTSFTTNLKPTTTVLNTILNTSHSVPDFPQNLSIRLFINSELSSQRQLILDNLKDLLASHNINIVKLFTPLAISAQPNTPQTTHDPQSTLQSHHLTDQPSNWLEYLNQNINTPLWQQLGPTLINNPEFLAIPSNPSLTNISQKVTTKNTKLTKLITDYQSTTTLTHPTHSTTHPTSTHQTTFEILNLEWDYILCFKDNNKFDFTKLPPNKIISISAKNGIGKTSLLEIIVIALFGEGFPSRTNKTYSASIINYNKPEKEKARTVITIKHNNDIYRITRNFSTHSADRNKIHNYPKDVLLDIALQYPPTTYKNIHSGKTATEAWIHKNICTLEQYLLSNMVTQNTDMDFFNLKSQDQKELIDNALNLQSSQTFLNILKESKLSHANIIETINTILSTYNISAQQELDLTNKITHLTTTINDLTTKITTLENIPPEWLKSYSLVNQYPHHVHYPTFNIQQTPCWKPIFHPDKFVNHITNAPLPTPTIPTTPYDIVIHELEKINRAKTKLQSLTLTLQTPGQVAHPNSTQTQHPNTIPLPLSYLEDKYKSQNNLNRLLQEHLNNKPLITPPCTPTNEQTTNAFQFNPACHCCKTNKLILNPVNTPADNWQETLEEYQTAITQWDNAIKEREIHNLTTIIKEEPNFIQLKEDWEILYTAMHYNNFNNLNKDPTLSIATQATDPRKELKALEQDLARTQYELAIYHTRKQEYTAYTQYLSLLSDRYDLILEMYNTFANYKTWLYTTKVIPFITTNVNNIINMLCENRPLQLECSMPTTQSSQSAPFHWFLRDSTQSTNTTTNTPAAPPIEKASGFQRFITSLAMRITIGRITNSNNKQLFIDEGFTACDADNLNLVGDFLNKLSTYMTYNNIIIVSHLEEVKQAAAHQIQITRQPGTNHSQLIY